MAHEFYEEEDALEWKLSSNQRYQKVNEITDNDSNTPITQPDETWLMPVMEESLNVSHHILGVNQDNLKHVEKMTNVHMKYNEKEARIEMWGAQKDLDAAIGQWNAIAKNVLSQLQKKKPRSQSRLAEVPWAKPEKAPRTKKAEEKIKRREARELEGNAYRDFPKPQTQLPFRGHFVWPITEFPISMYFRDNVLNSLNIETKCYIWYEPSSPSSGYYLTKISGNSRDSIEEATTRVRNLFIKVYQFKMIPNNGWIYHMIEPPHKPCMIKIVDPLPWIYLPYKFNNVKLIKSVDISVVGKEDQGNFQRIRESNTKSFKDALVKAFEAIHLSDCEIKMRIRFGHVCFTHYPNPYKYPDKLWSIENFKEKVLKNTRLESEFSTCIATEDQQLSRLSDLLSKSRLKWNGSSSREFKIHAIHTIPRQEEIPCVFLVQFNKFINNNRECGGKIGPWKVIMNDKNILDINMAHLDNDYSWKLNIQTAKRLPNKDKNDTHRQFVSKLRICPKGRLVYSNTNDIKVVSMCEKSRWEYWWKEEYIIEITRYEFWDLSHNKSASSYIEFHLNQECQPRATYGVTLYKKSWDDNFAMNSSLGIGEEPEWHPHEIMNEDLSGVDTLLSDIRAFLEVLQSNLPIKPRFIL